MNISDYQTSTMRVVIDTNVFISILPGTSKYHLLFWKWIEGKYSILLSNDIYFEYEEMLSTKLKPQAGEIFLQLIFEMENVEFIIPNFKWNLISQDPDDNKFADCAIAANADFIVTNDRHFDVLQLLEFPQLKVINIETFAAMLID